MTTGRAFARRRPLPAAVYEETYPRDPDFPQLEIATDPRRMLDVFRAALKPLAGKSVAIVDCVPFRFRCRQSGGRCVLQYTLRLSDPRTGREWDHWVTGLLYVRPGEAERLSRELRAADPQQGIPDDWLPFEPVDFIPELDMLVQVFPFDRKLRQLGLVLGDGIEPLERELLARLRPGSWLITRRTIVPTRYRTELGAALRLELQVRDARTGQLVSLCCYLKVFRNDHGEGTLAFLRACGDRETAATGFTVVRPLGYLPQVRTLALEEAPGTTLQHVLLNGRNAGPAVRAVARAVAAFNRAEPIITAEHRLVDQFADLHSAATLVQWACPETRAAVRKITDAVTAGLEEVPPAPIHRDLKPDHVFLLHGRVHFIDCDSVTLGDPARDPAHLFAHIVAGVGLDAVPLEQRRAAAAAFVEEYFARVPAPWRLRFPLHCAAALIEVAGGIFKRQEPRWSEKVAETVSEAGAVPGLA
ncbi:MAG TPA: phosphotransferase [Gemmatimonadales bacterium]|nr:phosphotransferase [Gemmatimonadales bacterium]